MKCRMSGSFLVRKNFRLHLLRNVDLEHGQHIADDVLDADAEGQAGLLDGWEIVVKPHPYLSVEADLRHELGAQAGRLRFADGPIATHLVPGTVVWSSASTTVVLEAALKKLPVMVMLPSDGFDLCPLQDVPGLLRTGSLDDVKRALAQAAPPALPDDYLELQPELPRWRALLEL